MEKLIKTSIFITLSLGILIAGIYCSDPTSSDPSKEIKVIVRGYRPAGAYVDFWDGTDKSNNFVEPGDYIARLYTQDFTFEIDMTVLSGSKGSSNDSTTFPDFTYQPLNELKQNRPNPFHAKDGTNLLYTLSEDYSMELSIRKLKD